MPSVHALLGASSAHRWLECPPSARLCEKLDAKFGKATSQYAEEGTKAHSLGEYKIRYEIFKEDKTDDSGIKEAEYNRLRAELGDIPEDMEHATDAYCDVVMAKYLQAKEEDSSARCFLEQQLDYTEFVPDGFGTGDCVIVSDKLLEICDYKHGLGIKVDAQNNPQLRLYAIGAVLKFKSLFDFDSVKYTIIQPRIENISEETMSVVDLIAWAKKEVVEKAKLAYCGKGEFKCGDHCRFCSAKAICGERVRNGLKVFETGLEAPETITDEQLVAMLPYLDDAKSWIDDLKAYVENQALHGAVIPGYKLVHGKKPNRVWNNEEEVKAQMIRAGYDKDTYEETKLKAVGKIEKVLGKQAFTALLSEYVSQGEGKLTLVPESDNRQAVSSADVSFDDLIINKNGETE